MESISSQPGGHPCNDDPPGTGAGKSLSRPPQRDSPRHLSGRMVLLLGLWSGDSDPGESLSWNGWSIDRGDAPRVPCGLQQREAGSIRCRAIRRTPRPEPSRRFSAAGGARKALKFSPVLWTECSEYLTHSAVGVPYRTSSRFALPRRALAAVLLFLLRGATGRPRVAAPARVVLLGGADSVLVEFVGQGAARESHSAGSFGLRSTGGREGLEDELLLGAFEEGGEIEGVGNRANERVQQAAVTVGRRRAGGCPGHGEIVRSDFPLAGKNVGPLDQVLELAQVAGKMISLQTLKGCRADLPWREL